MVFILGRRVNIDVSVSEDSDSPPAVRRKVFEADSKLLSKNDVLDFYSGSAHSGSIIQAFNEFRKCRLFIDVVIKVEGNEFQCHRAVLSACSAYFKAMFSNDHRESRELLVEINGITAKSMDNLLTFIYTGHAKINVDNAQCLFETANLFQVHALRDACGKFLEDQLDPCNCLGMQRFAERHSLKQLANRCRSFALANFAEVSEYEEFLHLSKEELESFISSDDACVQKEEQAFEAVMRWVYYNSEERKDFLEELLMHVRLPLLHPNYFVRTVEIDSLIQRTPECYQLLHEARRYHVLGNEMMSPRTCPRRSTGVAEVIVVIGGCERPGGFNLPHNECYDPLTGEWRSLAKLPEFTKSEYAVCTLRNDILVSGGRINSRDAWIYYSMLNMWIKVSSLTRGRWRHKMCALLGKVYAVGGYDGQSRLSSVECYDHFVNRWTEVAPMIVAVSSPAVVTCAGKLYVIGGAPDENTCSDKVQCYDPEENSWMLMANIPIAKRCISAVALNNMIYVCGGLTKTIYCYDPATNCWMSVAEAFYKLDSCGMSVCKGKIFILGGLDENGKSLDTILCYDPATGISRCSTTMPRRISHHGCGTIHRQNDKHKKP